MDKYLKYGLMVIMVLSLLGNFLLFLVIGVQETDWENQYYMNSVEWCEIVNDYGSSLNDLVIQLRYYDETYYDLDLFEEIDCFGGTSDGL